jgi:hypothetical protein
MLSSVTTTSMPFTMEFSPIKFWANSKLIPYQSPAIFRNILSTLHPETIYKILYSDAIVPHPIVHVLPLILSFMWVIVGPIGSFGWSYYIVVAATIFSLYIQGDMRGGVIFYSSLESFDKSLIGACAYVHVPIRKYGCAQVVKMYRSRRRHLPPTDGLVIHIHSLEIMTTNP